MVSGIIGRLYFGKIEKYIFRYYIEKFRIIGKEGSLLKSGTIYTNRQKKNHEIDFTKFLLFSILGIFFEGHHEIMDKNHFYFWYINENTEDIFGYW